MTMSSEIGSGTEQGTKLTLSLKWARTQVLAFDRYSTGNGQDPTERLRHLSEPKQSNQACTVLRGFLYWLCDRRRGPEGHRYQGVRYKSTLSTIVKYWCMAVKVEVGRRLEMDTVEALKTVRRFFLFGEVTELERDILTDRR